jgi:tetratricopeptide (TPR) repeat protein
VKEAVEDSGGNEWSFSSTQFEKCKLCGESYAGDTKNVLDVDRKARVEKATERLHGLLDICHETYDNVDESHCSRFIQLTKYVSVLCREIYGEDDLNSNDDIFWAHFFLGKALLLSGRLHDAVETLEPVRAKLHMQKPDGWKRHLRSATSNLATAYYRLQDHSKALPFFEALYDKHYHIYSNENQCWLKTWLVDCYFCTGALKEAQSMIEPTLRQSEEVNGKNHESTLKLKELRAEIAKASYNTAKTIDVEGIPDGTLVTVRDYSNGSFRVDSESSCEGHEFFTVFPQQVIMIPDSDVVLHSLKGAKHLN